MKEKSATSATSGAGKSKITVVEGNLTDFQVLSV